MARIKNFAAKSIAFAAALVIFVVSSCSKGLDITSENAQVTPPVDTTSVGEPYGYYVKDEKGKIIIVRQGGDRFDYNYNGFGLEARPDTIKRNASEGVKLLTTEKSVNGNDTLQFNLTDTYSEVLAKGILVNYSEKGKSYILTPEMGLKVKADLKVINSQETKFNFHELARIKFELWSDKSSVAQAKLLATDSIYVVTDFAAEMPADTTMVSWSESDKAVSAKVVTVLSGDTTVANYSLNKLHKLYAEELKEIKTDNLNFSSENSLTLSSTEKGNWAADNSGKLQAQVVVEKYNHKNSHRTNKVTRESYHEFVLKVNGKTFTYESKPAPVEFVKNNIGEKTSNGNTEVLTVESVYSSTWKGDVVTTSQHLKLIKEVAQNEQTVSVSWSETETEYVATVKVTNTVDTDQNKTYTRKLAKVHVLEAEAKKRFSSENFNFASASQLSVSSSSEGGWVYDSTKELKAQVVEVVYANTNSHCTNKVVSRYLSNFEISVNGKTYKNDFSAPTVAFVKDVIGSETTVGENIVLPVQVVYSSVLGGKTITATQEIELTKAAPKQNEQKIEINSEDLGEAVKVIVKISNTVDTQNDKTYTLSLSKNHSVKAEELKRIETNNFSTTYNGLTLQSTTPGNWVYDETGMLKAQRFVRTYVHSTSQGHHIITQSYNCNFIVTVNGVDYPISLSEPTISFSQERKGSAQMSGETVEIPVSLDYSSVYGKSTKTTTQEIVLYANAISFAGEKILVVSRTDAYNTNMSAPEGTYDCVLSETATGYNFRYRKVGATNWTVLSLATADGERLLAMNKALAVFKGSPWDAGCVEVAPDNNKSIVYYRYDYTGATDAMGFPIGRYAIDVVNSTFDGEKGDPVKGYAVMKSGENLLQMKIDGNGSLFFINL